MADGRFYEQSVNGISLELGEGLIESIGRCRIEKCRISIRVGRYKPIIVNSDVIASTVRLIGTLRDTQSMMTANYVDCSFVGTFLGVDFGRLPGRPGYILEPGRYGDLINCDFTRARLEACRIFDANLDGLLFGSWPQFRVTRASLVKAASMNRNWPGKFSIYIKVGSESHPTVVARADDARRVMRFAGIGESELRECLDIMGAQY